MPGLSAADDGPHAPPPGTGPDWRESVSLDWYDPAAGAAAAYRIRVNWARGGTEVRTWTLTDGTVTSRTSRSGPAGDLADLAGLADRAACGRRTGHLEAGDVRIRTLRPLRSYAVSLAAGTEVRYTAAADAFRFSMSGQRADPGGEHYESFGTVTGTVCEGSRVSRISGRGFYRHWWGVASPGTHPVQSARGMFDDDLFFSVTEFRTAAGSAPLGYLFAGGEFHGVEKARFRTQAGSGVPRGCDLLIATADRRDFRIPGRVAAAARNGPGFATFDLGRRQGSGILELYPGPGGGRHA